MFWMNAYNAGNLNINEYVVRTSLCPSMRDTILAILARRGIPASALLGDSSLGGCVAVSPLPSASNYQRVAYKFYFSLSAAQWTQVYGDLATQAAIKTGHVMCGSDMYFQTYSPVTNSRNPINPTTNPQWLNPSQGAATTCYTDALAPLKP